MILSSFIGLKVIVDFNTSKIISKLAKEHKMFLLASHSGVKYYITDSQDNLESFKNAINTL